MNEAEQVFRETEIERKKNGYGAKHRPRGGGAVRLPSDSLTKKELEAMNGEITAWKEKPFYDYEEFKALPDDIKLKWVNSLNNLYGVGVYTIGEVCFGERSRCKTVLEQAGLLGYVNGSGRKGQGGQIDKAKLRTALEEYRKTAVKPRKELDAKLIHSLGVLEGLSATMPDNLRELAGESLKYIWEYILTGDQDEKIS